MSHALIVWYALLLHATWALTVALSPTAFGATPMADLAALFGEARALAVGLLVVASGTALASLFVQTWWGVFLLLPQQMVLLLSAHGSLAAILRGSYADGVPRPQEFIATDQIGMVLLAIVHVGTLVLRGRESIWLRRLGF